MKIEAIANHWIDHKGSRPEKIIPTAIAQNLLNDNKLLLCLSFFDLAYPS